MLALIKILGLKIFLDFVAFPLFVGKLLYRMLKMFVFLYCLAKLIAILDAGKPKFIDLSKLTEGMIKSTNPNYVSFTERPLLYPPNPAIVATIKKNGKELREFLAKQDERRKRQRKRIEAEKKNSFVYRLFDFLL